MLLRSCERHPTTRPHAPRPLVQFINSSGGSRRQPSSPHLTIPSLVKRSRREICDRTHMISRRMLLVTWHVPRRAGRPGATDVSRLEKPESGRTAESGRVESRGVVRDGDHFLLMNATPGNVGNDARRMSRGFATYREFLRCMQSWKWSFSSNR